MCEVKEKLIKIISLLEYLIYIEDFGAYHSLLKKYNIVLDNLNQKKDILEIMTNDFDPLLNVFRIFLEAHPSDNKLGKYILDKMQEFYELQEKLLNN